MLWHATTSLHEYSPCLSTYCSSQGRDLSWTTKFAQQSKASVLSVFIFLSRLSLFYFPLHDEWLLLCYAACVHLRLHAECIDVSVRPRTLSAVFPPRCWNSCSLFISVAQKNAACVPIPSVAWFSQLYCVGSCCEVAHLHSYFHNLILILCWFLTTGLLYFGTMGVLEVQGVPSPTHSH